MPHRDNDSFPDHRFNPVEFGEMKQAIRNLGERQGDLEERISEQLGDLANRLSTFTNQYSKDRIHLARAQGRSEGGSRLKHGFYTTIISVVTSSAGLMILAKLLHIPIKANLE